MRRCRVPGKVEGLFRPHYVTWSEQQKIEFSAPDYLRNVIRIITETRLRIYKELIPMKKDQVDLENGTVWIPDGGVADEWVTQLLRHGDAKVLKKYSQTKLQMKREALTKINRQANEGGSGFGTVRWQKMGRKD
jgi:integrase